jgi:hypothetical protein
MYPPLAASNSQVASVAKASVRPGAAAAAVEGVRRAPAIAAAPIVTVMTASPG